MKIITLALLAAATTLAATDNPLVDSGKGFYASVKNDVLRSAEKVPEELWSFKPTPEVRSFGQLIAHEADGQYEFCGTVATGKAVMKDTEKSNLGKAATIAALKEAFAYCDATWAKLNDESAKDIVSFFGTKSSKLGVMDFNTAHTNEHYGNMVTYMRLEGMVPSSSEPRK